MRRAKRSCCCAAQVSGHCDHWTHLLPRLQPGRRSPMKLGVLTHQIGISWISWTKNCQQYDIWVCLKSCTAKKPLRIFTSHHFHHDFHHDFWSSLGYHIQTRPPIEKPKTLNITSSATCCFTNHFRTEILFPRRHWSGSKGPDVLFNAQTVRTYDPRANIPTWTA